MKSTGVVRRVDELGRIVIPMELRKTLNIVEKDPLEIFVASGMPYPASYARCQEDCVLRLRITS